MKPTYRVWEAFPQEVRRQVIGRTWRFVDGVLSDPDGNCPLGAALHIMGLDVGRRPLPGQVLDALRAWRCDTRLPTCDDVKEFSSEVDSCFILASELSAALGVANVQEKSHDVLSLAKLSHVVGGKATRGPRGISETA